MKTRNEYDSCYKAIMNCKLAAPHVYQPFTEYFDIKKLANVQDKYGYDLYIRCLRDATEVVEKYGF